MATSISFFRTSENTNCTHLYWIATQYITVVYLYTNKDRSFVLATICITKDDMLNVEQGTTDSDLLKSGCFHKILFKF